MEVDEASSATSKNTIEQCVQLLSSSTDEQKFVGLLLATKLMKTSDDLVSVFEVGLPFVRRMMMTPSKEAANPYRALALSVLASFGADPALASRSDFCSAAAATGPLFSQHLRAGDMTAEELHDCGQVLLVLLQQPRGLVEPVYGRLLSTVIAPAAACALVGPPGGSAEAAANPSGVAADACAHIERVCEAHLHRVATAADTSGSTASTIALELVAAARVLCPAVGALKDALAFGRLRALRTLIEAVAVLLQPSEPQGNEGELKAAIEALGPELRSALSAPVASKLNASARRDALRAIATATALCGPTFLVGEPPSVAAAAAAAPPPPSELPKGGALLVLVLQLCSVELQMCLHDQPADTVSDACLGVLPACCSLLEQALFRLHSDCDDDDDEDEEAAFGDDQMAVEKGKRGEEEEEDPWLAALSDDQVISAQKAFQRAIMAALEYLETLRSEAAEKRKHARPPDASAATSSAAPSELSHVLLAPVARLVSAWLAQPSASTLMELYDRACSLMPVLRSAAATMGEGGDDSWAGHLEGLEERRRAEDHHGSDDEGEGGDDAGAPPQETMADLFTRLMPKDPAMQMELARRAAARAAAAST